jgi:hypothetical protein
MDDIIVLVAVGEYYNQEIKDYYWDLKNSGFTIKVLTDEPSHYNINDISLYNRPIFNYFDKIHFSLKIVEEYGKNVIYMDGTSALPKHILTNISSRSESDFIYTSNWPKGNFYGYEDDPCFRYLFEYFRYKNIPIINYPTILEQVMVFKKTINYKLINKELQILQTVFDYISVMNDNTYIRPFVLGSAEGLALSIVLTNNDIPFTKIDI